jgi:hypothetical protein
LAKLPHGAINDMSGSLRGPIQPLATTIGLLDCSLVPLQRALNALV